ncbi:MAG TPA: MBL fold metallo-hydrolase [Candidatus Kryptonia bacterium]
MNPFETNYGTLTRSGGAIDTKSPLPPKELIPRVFAFPPNPDSFGGISYLVKTQSNSFMVDVPEYIRQNIGFIENTGIPEFVFLTHRDDVADADLFRREFGTKLIIHQSEKYAVKSPDITFQNSLKLNGVEIIHTPGHSPGSSCLYFPAGRVMFTGDHITADGGKPVAEDFSWTYDYELQILSGRKILEYDFQFILAGHGGRWLIRNAKEELKKFIDGSGIGAKNG